MKAENIVAAAEEAKRFLKAVIALQQRTKKDSYFKDYYEYLGFKETAAIRRSSLDLSRALSKMRNE